MKDGSRPNRVAYFIPPPDGGDHGGTDALCDPLSVSKLADTTLSIRAGVRAELMTDMVAALLDIIMAASFSLTQRPDNRHLYCWLVLLVFSFRILEPVIV